MSDARRSVFLAMTVLALGLGLAASSQAANQQYKGSLVMDSFGNDAGTATPPGVFTVFGMPQGVDCYPAQPRCPYVSTPVTVMGGKKAFNPLGTACAPISYFGATMHAAKGATPTTGPLQNVRYRNPVKFTVGGSPNPTLCRATTTISGMQATKFISTNSTKRGVAMKGAPLTGQGIVTLIGKGPAGFKVKAAPAAPVKTPGPTGFGLRRTTSGSFNAGFPYLYSYTYATLRNDAGSFFAGGGPGAFDLKYYVGKARVARAKVTAGPNKFGGVMRLLGKLTTRVCYFRNGGCSLGGHNWRYEEVGAPAYTSMGVVTGGYIATYVAKYYHTNLMQVNTVPLSGSRFPWTTGDVTLTAKYRGPHRTFEVRKGYDNRTSQGMGTIQLVTPLLTRWLLPGFEYETGGIGILRLAFVPEPGKWALLAGGLGMLGLLYRLRRR